MDDHLPHQTETLPQDRLADVGQRRLDQLVSAQRGIGQHAVEVVARGGLRVADRLGEEADIETAPRAALDLLPRWAG